MLAYTNPLTRGKTFKARVVGAMRKDLQAGKLATAMASGLPALMGLPDSYELSNVDDPNCGLPYDVIEENVFANCFEFIIGGKEQLIVEASQDSLYPGGSTVLTAKLLTIDGDTLTFGQDQPFEIALSPGSSAFGSLLFANGDTLDAGTNPGPDFGLFSDAPIEEEQELEITLITAYEDQVLRTTKSIKVLEPYDLNIDFEDNNQVFPTLRDADITNVQGYDNTKSIVVSVTEKGIPIQDHEIELRIEFILGTGGHDHTTAPNDSLLGTLENTITNTTAQGSIRGITNENGEISFSYTASEIGGQMQFEVRSLSQLNMETDTLQIRVPNLIAFEGIGDYELTGQTDVHSSNHFIANQAALDALLEASADFSIADWNETGMMRINDLSLEYGGIFDISGQWEGPHDSHRTGRNVDIENIASVDSTVVINGVERTIRVFDNDWINRYLILMGDNNWRFLSEGQQDPFRENPRLRYPHFNWEGN